ncbi:MAG: hypothetical protein A2X05_14080 [Bacteroidetes bacterium GWE2_41_25]|nr:MAG: hypothetical protein A2X03_10910 [Bacteroidetes bacterium GWA2_40_15]OFX83529.1 MAG: hypothetical protein A2X06_08825 [Bacteroidetes bacterium GWC2_40_22]OFX95456.1 MAG: hypothetical protein A2X05_14080 [Bacteroidetes bacterium GWE2_41_25]HAM09987.1 hypothetical protein [Bacteroidales bacterium]HBH84456.1 hypothetical protein [Bacteroidales bacterium]
MNKGINVLIIFLLGSVGNVFSQELTHQVLVPVAGVSSNGSINYSQTIGETAVEILNCSNFVFTQGFQQPGIKFSKENPPPGNGVKVYPNPVTDYVTIELFGTETREFRIEFFNISGTMLRVENIVFKDQYWYNQQYSVERYIKGLFFIKVTSEDGVINRTFKVEKL